MIHPIGASQRSLAEMRHQLAAPESRLANGRRWPVGDTWSIADAHFDLGGHCCRQNGPALEGLPAVVELLDRQMEQPEWQAMLARDAAA